jgi:Tfp pilus assembly protein PilV
MRKISTALTKFWRLRRLRRSGFSLLDVLVGVVILALALFSALALASNNARLVSANQNVAAASLLAQNKMEELRNSTYSSLVSGNDSGTLNAQGAAGGIFHRSWTVTANSPMVGMKTLLVTITWSQFGESKTYVLHGEVAQ